jgi:hypothetical protein
VHLPQLDPQQRIVRLDAQRALNRSRGSSEVPFARLRARLLYERG